MVLLPIMLSNTVCLWLLKSRVITIRPPFGEHVLLFAQKKFVLRERQKMAECPPFRHYMNCENVPNHSSTKNFGRFQCYQRSADVMTFFFGLNLIFGQKNGHLRT